MDKLVLLKAFRTYLPFSLLFGLIPYRICGIFHLDYSYRLGIGMLFFFFFFFLVKEVVISILNSILAQLTFFYFLSLENFIFNLKTWHKYFFVFSFSFYLGAWPNQIAEDPLFWYLFMLFFYTYYRQMRDLFVNPELEASIYSLDTVKKEEDLTWELIVLNMSSICLTLFGQPVQNQLGKPMSQRSFNQVSKRYIFTRIMAAVKTYPEAITIVGGAGACFGFGVTEYRNMVRHGELLMESKRANELQQQMVLEAKRANELQQQMALEAKRANDLKQQEIISSVQKLPAKPKDLSSGLMSFQDLLDTTFFL